MQSALRITAKVLPGDKVEIKLPPGSVGEEVEIFVILPEKPQPSHRFVKKRLSEFYGALPATTPYPGKEAIRQIVADVLAQQILPTEES